MSNDYSVNAIFSAVDRFTAPVRSMQKKLDGFIESSEKGLRRVDKFNDRIGSGIKRVGAVATVGAIATAAIVKDIVETGAAFDKVLVGAAAKFNPEIKRGTAGFEQLRATAEKIGEDTEFNAQQAAEGLKSLASAGFTTDQAMATLPAVVDLATASEIDLGVAAEMATKSLGAFGLKVEDSTKLAANLTDVTNVMAIAANKTEASMEGLFESIKEGGPVAVAAGQSMRTFMAMTATMAGAGIEGSVAGTTMKNTLLALSAPTAKASAAFAKLKIKTQDSNGNVRDAIEVFADLEKALAGMGTGKRTAILEKIFGKIPLAGVSAMLQKGADSMKKLRGEFDLTDISAHKMAESMRDTVSGDLDELSSKIDGVKIALFTTNNTAIRETIQSMTQWVAANKEFIVQNIGATLKWIGENLESIVTWGKRVAIFAGVFWLWSTAIKAVILAVEGYQAAVTIATALNFLFKKSMAAWSPKPIAEATGQMSLFGEETVKTKGGFAAMREALNATKFATKIEGLSGLMKGGLLVAAAGVGVAIGTWANETFGLDEKISGLIARVTGLDDAIEKAGGRADKAGLDPKGDQYLADGSIRRADGTWVKKTAAREAKELADAGKAFSKGIAQAGKGISVVEPTALPAFSPLLPPADTAPQVVSPQERVAASIEEKRTTERSELTIKDETGRAAFTKKPRGRAAIKLQPSGAF